MSVKVKRGLGLLVVAAIGLIVGNVLMRADASGAAEWPVFIGTLIAVVAIVGGLIGGLVLIAWGLLRE